MADFSEAERLEQQKNRIKELVAINAANNDPESIEVLYKYLMSDGYEFLQKYEGFRQSSNDKCMKFSHSPKSLHIRDTLNEFQTFISRKFQQ